MNFVDELKEYLATTPVEQQIKDWEDIKKDIPIDCGIIWFNPYEYEKEKANEQAKVMDEANKRKEALQNERELNPDTFTKEVSADNQALEEAAEEAMQSEIDDGAPYTDGEGMGLYPPDYLKALFIDGAKWQREQMIKSAVDGNVMAVKSIKAEQLHNYAWIEAESNLNKDDKFKVIILPVENKK